MFSSCFIDDKSEAMRFGRVLSFALELGIYRQVQPTKHTAAGDSSSSYSTESFHPCQPCWLHSLKLGAMYDKRRLASPRLLQMNCVTIAQDETKQPSAEP